MPYQLAFNKQLSIEDPETYFNDCCIGGDQIAEHLLPAIGEKYSDIQHQQEDWGWFIWFQCGATRLAVDIFCDDPSTGAYRVFLTSQRKGRVFGYKVLDTPELDELKASVLERLEAWADSRISESLLNKSHDPIDNA